MGERNPLLYRGESYASYIEKKQQIAFPTPPKTFEEGRRRLCEDVQKLSQMIQDKEEIFFSQKTFCIRMEENFEAKSYAPQKMMSVHGISHVGGRKYKADDIEADAKLYFVKANDRGIKKLLDALSVEQEMTNRFRKEVPFIRSIDLLKPSEKICGFSDEWDKGAVEVVLHPEVEGESDTIEGFFKEIEEGTDIQVGKKKRYDDGPIFCTLRCSEKDLEQISKFNCVRTIHPIWDISIPPVENVVRGKVKLSQETVGRVSIGIFDGGVSETSELLGRYIRSYDLTKAEPHSAYVEHGTRVCGAAVFGPLYDGDEAVPAALVNSFRVLPAESSDPLFDLFDIVDSIEETVSKRPDIQVYSVSFGPRGAIIDDELSRFTYSLDKLSTLQYHPVFCVAVGNNGDLESPFDRICAPSDMVNGIGVGSYSKGIFDKKIRAGYSCVGPGREGCKTKPDILEIGGDEKNPLLLISSSGTDLVEGYGTSYAAPILARKLGQVIAGSPDISPQVARLLVIHTAERDKEDIRKVGHGFCKERVEDILSSDIDETLTIYSGVITPSKSVKLQIPFPPELNQQGQKVRIKWTITTIAQPDPLDVDSYTVNCIEDSFCPHSKRYRYTFVGEKRTPKTALITEEGELIKAGYTRSALPITKSAKDASEAGRRAIDFKWDTVVKKEITMMPSSLNEPYLLLHAMIRKETNAEIRYNVAVSVSVPEYKGDLLAQTVNSYPMLVPIRIESTNKMEIRTPDFGK